MRLLLLSLLLLAFASGCATSDTAPRVRAGPGVKLGPDDRMPTIIYTEPPEYPLEARKAGVTGVVRVEFIVAKDGRVAVAKAISSPDERLSRAAEAAVLRWRFLPAVSNHRIVNTLLQQDITFDLR